MSVRSLEEQIAAAGGDLREYGARRTVARPSPWWSGTFK